MINKNTGDPFQFPVFNGADSPFNTIESDAFIFLPCGADLTNCTIENILKGYLHHRIKIVIIYINFSMCQNDELMLTLERIPKGLLWKIDE